MKLRIRKSSLKGRRLHGFRAKPASHRKRLKKLRDIKRLRRKRANWTINRK